MKRLLLLSLLFISCAQDKIDIVYNIDKTTFDKKSVVVTDKTPISFELPADGIYNMVIVDELKNETVTRERFTGKTGVNSLTIYTYAVNKGSYLLKIEQNNKTINTLNIKL